MIKKYWKIAVAAAFLTAAGFCYGFMRMEPEERTIKLSAPGEASGIAAEAEAADDGEAGGSEVLSGGAETGLEASSGGAAGGQTSADGQVSGGAESGQTSADGQVSDDSAANQKSSGEPVPSSAALCFVHICGEVEAPGVYELLEGSRLFQAVEAAGGMTEQAAADSVNLAAPVRDGMQVRIPSLEEVRTLSKEELRALLGGVSPEVVSGLFSKENGGEAGTGKEPGVGGQTGAGKALVNLNTAGAEELMSLNGIGKARAEEIIRYRSEHGSFQSIEDIKNIPGIKDALFQKIKDSITV